MMTLLPLIADYRLPSEAVATSSILNRQSKIGNSER